MPTAITHDVKVSVETIYQPGFSNPLMAEHVFAYKITIVNHSEYTIQLLRRHWVIVDSNGEHREVEGEGIVGVQPTLAPGESHTYMSACNLKSDMGKMSGSYLFERRADGRFFHVDVPEFHMIVPNRFN